MLGGRDRYGIWTKSILLLAPGDLQNWPGKSIMRNLIERILNRVEKAYVSFRSFTFHGLFLEARNSVFGDQL
jgi:hypothetical protein